MYFAVLSRIEHVDITNVTAFSIFPLNLKELYKMPVWRFTKIDQHSAHLVWYIGESEEALLSIGKLSTLSQTAYKKITHPRRKREWLAARLALKNLLARLGHDCSEAHKDSWGRPYLTNSNLYLSIAHCFPFALVAVDQKHDIGIDIQLPCRQLQAVKTKFLMNKEIQDSGSDLEKLCIYWCAKEAIYKAHGGKGLSLKQDIYISRFTKQTQGIAWGKIDSQLFIIHYSFYKGHVVAWSRATTCQH